MDCKTKYGAALLSAVHPPPQALQALGFVLSGDGDVDSLSSDEKSDGEGKTDRMSSSSSSIASSTDTQEVSSVLGLSTHAARSEFMVRPPSAEVTLDGKKYGVCVCAVQSSRSNPDSRR